MTVAAEHPGAVLGVLEADLRHRGIGRLYGAAYARYGVLSIGPGLTVWCDGQRLRWTRDGERAGWPAADPGGAAAELAKLTAQ